MNGSMVGWKAKKNHHSLNHHHHQLEWFNHDDTLWDIFVRKFEFLSICFFDCQQMTTEEEEESSIHCPYSLIIFRFKSVYCVCVCVGDIMETMIIFFSSSFFDTNKNQFKFVTGQVVKKILAWIIKKKSVHTHTHKSDERQIGDFLMANR